MAGNSAFIPVDEHGWQRGISNLLANEFHRWWGTRMWLVQSLIWVGVIGFFLVTIMFSSQGAAEPLETAVTIYGLFGGMFPAIAVIIIMQDVLVGEKQSGTAAWVLSKPVAREAFVISRILGNAFGVMVTMVLLPGIVAYVLFSIKQGQPLPPLGFLAAMGVIFVSLMFYLTLTLMLGALFNNRGAVIGIALALAFGQQFLIGMLPVLSNFLPWFLTVPANGDGLTAANSTVSALMLGSPAPYLTTLAVVAVESIIFVVIAIWRFRKEEF